MDDWQYWVIFHFECVPWDGRQQCPHKRGGFLRNNHLLAEDDGLTDAGLTKWTSVWPFECFKPNKRMFCCLLVRVFCLNNRVGQHGQIYEQGGEIGQTRSVPQSASMASRYSPWEERKIILFHPQRKITGALVLPLMKCPKTYLCIVCCKLSTETKGSLLAPRLNVSCNQHT